MAESQLINSDVAIELLKRRMNTELIAAAQPVIDEAMANIEKAMRQKLGSMVIAYLDSHFNVERDGSDLRIIVKHK